MMSDTIVVHCPHCTRFSRAPRDAAGRKVECHICKWPFTATPMNLATKTQPADDQRFAVWPVICAGIALATGAAVVLISRL
jgi:hypothetical protein